MKQCENLEAGRLLEEAKSLSQQGFRIVQICCVKGLEEKQDLFYSFDLAYEWRHYRISVAPGDVIPSITGAFPGAFLYENEIGELFGIVFKGVSLDFHGTLYDSGVAAPFAAAAAARKSEAVN